MKNYLLKVVGLGAVAGMRITFGPAFLSHYFTKHPQALEHSALRFLSNPKTARFAATQVVLEMITDKNPDAPDRIGKPQIFLRIGAGGFAGAVLATASQRNRLGGLLLGSAAAWAAAYLAFYARTTIDRQLKVKDFYTGLAEDALALGTAALVTR